MTLPVASPLARATVAARIAASRGAPLAIAPA
jgi:hypothetical protein